MNNHPNIDYEDLKRALADMKPRERLFELVKAELQRRGHWKQLKRGKPGTPPRH
jgi:hypothetical protein